MSTAHTPHETTPLLIKSNTCPACRTATHLLERAEIPYDVLSDSDEGYGEAVSRYGVRHVPTLILHPTGAWEALVGTDAIRDYIDRTDAAGSATH